SVEDPRPARRLPEVHLARVDVVAGDADGVDRLTTGEQRRVHELQLRDRVYRAAVAHAGHVERADPAGAAHVRGAVLEPLSHHGPPVVGVLDVGEVIDVGPARRILPLRLRRAGVVGARRQGITEPAGVDVPLLAFGGGRRARPRIASQLRVATDAG